jgi:ATP-dependent helicase HrpA
MLADDEALFAFFDAHIPESAVNGKTFEAWREQTRAAGPDPLALTLADVLVGEPDLVPASYPDTVVLHGTKLPITYRFDPAADDDGITLTVPLAFLPQVDPDELHGTIPGWHRDKIAALLYELPKAYRREINDVPAIARAIAPKVPSFGGPYVEAIAAALREETGVDVPVEVFRPDAIAPFLRTTLRLVDGDGHVLASSRDVAELGERFGAKARHAFQAVAKPTKFERTGLRTWDFGDLPDHINREIGKTTLRSYPAIVDRGDSVDLVLAESAAAAREASRAGLARLLAIAARGEVAAVSARLPHAPPTPSGAPVSRTADTAFRAMLLERIVEEAFFLRDPARHPRTRPSFDTLLTEGRTRLPKLGIVYTDAVNAATTALARATAALKSAEKQPSGRGAVVEIRGQIALLFAEGFIGSVPLGRLASYPRYLKAAEARLGRAIADPRKDTDKLAPILPIFKRLETRRAALAAAGMADDTGEIRWLVEELRVATFAPELKPEGPISPAKVLAALDALGRDPRS